MSHDPLVDIPDIVATNARRYFGETGVEWATRLPVSVGDMAARWSLTLLPHFAGLSINYVTPVLRADGTPAVLKIGFPGADFTHEAAALRAFDGRACVRLLDSDIERGALLLERLRPGETLPSLRDDVAETAAVATVMRALWRPPPADHVFPTAAEWLASAQAKDAIPQTKRSRPWLEPALAQADELADEQGTLLLLHGDLHHDNVLSTRDGGWLAIDPQGVVANPCWEVAPFLVNNLPDDRALWPALMRHRADQLAEALGLDRQRLYAWTAARALQGAFWSLVERDEHHGIWEAAVVCAEELARGPER